MSSRTGQHTSQAKVKTVLALFADGLEGLGGCEIYRITKPLYHLSLRNGWETAWSPIGLRTDPRVRHALDVSDIIVLPRYWISEEMAAEQRADNELVRMLIDHDLIDEETFMPFIEVAQRLGKKIVYEVDDDFTNRHREVHGGGDGAMRVAAMCDAITVSTPHLKEVMKEETGIESVHVVPNCVDMSEWSRPGHIRPYKGLTIGLSGSTTHHDDWAVLEDVMPEILDKHNVKFVLGGYFPEYFDYLPRKKVMRIEGLPYDQYTGLVRSFDIALAPIRPDDRFNWSKSGIKAIEAMAAQRKINGRNAGACVLATKSNVYDRVVRHERTGLLVEHTPEAWYEALTRVIEDVELRHKLSFAGHKWVRQHRDINTKWIEWAKAYNKILAEN